MTGHRFPHFQILWTCFQNHVAQQVRGLNLLSPRVIKLEVFPLEFEICAGPCSMNVTQNNDTKYTKEPNTVHKYNIASFLRGHHIKTAWISVCHEGPCGSGPISRGCLATKHEWGTCLNSTHGAEWISKGTIRQKVNYVEYCHVYLIEFVYVNNIK